MFQPGIKIGLFSRRDHRDHTVRDDLFQISEGRDPAGYIAGGDAKPKHKLVVFLVGKGKIPVSLTHGAEIVETSYNPLDNIGECTRYATVLCDQQRRFRLVRR